MSYKSIVFPLPQYENSCKSNKTFTNYNINDYLPPTLTSISRTTSYAFNSKAKIYTQPNEKNSMVEVREIQRKLENCQEEKEGFRKELGDLRNNLQLKENVINQKDEIIKELRNQVHCLQQSVQTIKLKQPNLSFNRNNFHFLFYPKFSQKYQVSVQTDTIEVSSNIASSSFTKKIVSKLADKDLHEIQQKLSKLNPMKKSIKQKIAKPTNDFLLVKPKKIQKTQTIFPQKQNMMRLSNTFQRVTNIGQQKFREQTIQIMPIDNDQLQRLIRLYMQ